MTRKKPVGAFCLSRTSELPSSMVRSVAPMLLDGPLAPPPRPRDVGPSRSGASGLTVD